MTTARPSHAPGAAGTARPATGSPGAPLTAGAASADRAADGASPTAYLTAVSADGSRIAYERFGSGPAIILIGGALNDRRGRASGVALARLLAARFTAVAYDRRGRGDSTAAGAYAAAREIDDLRALIADVGGPAALFGMSSGAALAIAAAAAGLPVTRVALYDSPFSTDAAAATRARAYATDLAAVSGAGDNDGALALFLAMIGMPPPAIDGMRRGPAWPSLAAIAATLTQDAAVLDSANGAPLPAAALGKIAVPLLALAGGASPPMLRESARRVADAARHGTFATLPGETHDVSAAALATALTEFLGG